MKRILVFALTAILLLSLLPLAFAEEGGQTARELSFRPYYMGGESYALTDGGYTWVGIYGRGMTITLYADEPMASLYIEWEEPPEPWTLKCGEQEIPAGQNAFVHEYIALPEPVTELELLLPPEQDTIIAEMHVFSEGEKPDWVQDWLPPWQEADVFVLPTHSDDEFVFLGGVIPACIERGLRVQVGYIIRHNQLRRHEMLNSLWTAGVRHYPVTSRCGDIYVGSQYEAESAYGLDYMTGYLVEQIRRFRPQVIVAQAEDGESGHNAHIFGVRCLKAALEVSATAGAYPESEQLYGLYDVPKTYLHLYGRPEERTVLDFETPLPTFGGATAYEVACRAFEQCVSQVEIGRYRVFGADSPYDCHQFGLYRSLVGPDLKKNDLFENLPLAGA